MRQDITFTSGPDDCAGWFYLPDNAVGDVRVPVIVMAHGFSAVKEQGLDAVAQRFCAAGFAVLVFDFRHFGASGGMPRGQLFPHAMTEDYRNAISWVCRQPQVDPARVGLWGTSFSGGIATHAATIDRRVKAVVAQAPSLMNAETRRAMDPARWSAVGAFLEADRIPAMCLAEVNARFNCRGDSGLILGLPGKSQPSGRASRHQARSSSSKPGDSMTLRSF